ncbi:MAG: DinB family protein [Candidatus Eiseniibacteriota bacterium]
MNQQTLQTPQTALSTEAGTLADKFSGLARVMAGKYGWKPVEGVRSVGDVFNLIVDENGILAGTLTGVGGGRGAPITDPEEMQAALKTSYANLQKTISGLSDSEVKAPVKLFGKDFTKDSAIRYLFGDQHEHLGQSIAYARSNGVVPPWSK